MNEKWDLKKLKDIGEILRGNSINASIKKEKYLKISNGLPYVATKDVGFDSTIDYNNGVKIPLSEIHSFRIAPKNSVLICIEGGSAGRKVGRTNQDICFVNKLFALSTDNETTSKYVFYWYKSDTFQTDFKSKLTGLIGGVSKKKFETIQIPMPSLPEQKRIVVILDKCYEAINKAKANVEHNLQNAKELFKSELNQIFTKKGDGWVKNPLAKLCEPNRIITYGVIKLGEEIPDGVPCLRTSNVRWLEIDISVVKRISPSLSNEFSRTILNCGEILVNVRGSLGGVAVVTEEMIGWNVSREVAVVPIDPSKINNNYLSFWIGSDYCQKWLGGVKKGAAYVGINIEDLRKLPVEAPNLNDQRKIAKEIISLRNKTKTLESKYQQEINALDELKKSILQKAFNGELTTAEEAVA